MDSFINLAKQGYEAYSESQSNVSKTGGHELNSADNSPRTHSQGTPQIDHDAAIHSAQSHGSGSSALFESALGFLSDNKDQHHEPVDEEEVQRSHDKAYQNGAAGSLSAGSMGAAAAMQILKKFTSSGSGGSSGGSQTQLISMAMAEASKLFDKSGGAASGDKQDAINGAAMTVMKLLVQSKFGGGTTGGGNSGGLGALMSMASRFM